MPHKVYINGKMLSEEKALISVFDRSYLYGEGVFETIRAYGGRPAFCDMHYHRLKMNAEKLKIDLPLDEYAFEHAVVKTINANKLKEAVVRVTLSLVGASTGISRPQKFTNNFVIFARAFKGRSKEAYERGIRVMIVQSVYADDPYIAEIKTTSYITKMLARAEVQGSGADEGILQNRSGLILEGTAANLFLVKGGRLYTPPLSDGCLAGITRWVVMGLAEELGIQCKESHLIIDDLKYADEIFMTGSTSEILPIREIDGVVKKSLAPGKVTRLLMEAYKKLIASASPPL